MLIPMFFLPFHVASVFEYFLTLPCCSFLQYMSICSRHTFLFPDLIHLIKQICMVDIRWWATQEQRLCLTNLVASAICKPKCHGWLKWGDEEVVGKWTDCSPVTFLLYVPPPSTGSRNPHGLKSCWGYTELGSQMLNRSLDSASIKKEKSQFQTF